MTREARPGKADDLRKEMVERLEASGAIRSAAVRQAFLAVAREHFVPEIAARDGLEAVYRPQAALVTATDQAGRAISSASAPAIMALMLEALELGPGMSVLEVGAGTGYNAALLERLVGPTGRVVSLELEPAFARRARRALREVGSRCAVVARDGRLGHERSAPFDRIIVTASTEQLPRTWCEQLVEGGLVEVPMRLVAGGSLQAVITFRREGAFLRSVTVLPGGFMPLRGAGLEQPAEQTPLLGGWVNAGRRTRARHNVVSLSSNAGSSMAASVARRSLATMLGPSRVAGVLQRERAEGLIMFLALSSDRRLCACSRDGRFGYAVVGDGGSSVAAVTIAFGTGARIEQWGGDEAGRRLEEHIERLSLLGKPRLSELRVCVDFDESTRGASWRTRRLAGSTIRIDWLAPPVTRTKAR
ncbi:MAG TPA: methyltransferase domain-containing protein [Acidimicrobiales bacterium]|nr:methyltransferase domain-containing protein [Acidimicrobiales bacterium]